MSRQIDRLEGLKVNHSHSFNVTYSRSYLVQVTIVELFLFSLVHNAWQLKRGWRLKYRYVLMSGNADAKTLDRLENCFEWNRDRKLIWKIRKEVFLAGALVCVAFLIVLAIFLLPFINKSIKEFIHLLTLTMASLYPTERSCKGFFKFC